MTTVEVVCYKYKPLKNGELPIKIRIIKDRKIRYVNLGVSTKREYWDFKRNEPKDKCPQKEILEKLIANKISEIKSEIVELKASDKEFTATSLLHHLNKEEKVMSVADVFQQHLKFLQDMKRTGYMLSVKQTFNSLVKYCDSLDIPFSDIGVGWLGKYELWLRKQGISDNTIGIRFRNLRMIYNLAITQGYAKKENYPFETYKLSRLHKATAKRAIHKEDVLTIMRYYECTSSFYTRLAVDLFMFSYFMGGINFVDMAYLTSRNIQGDRLVYTRRKTSKLINLPLGDDAKVILQRQRNIDKTYLFPVLSSEHKTEQQRLNRLHKVITKVNRELKQIGKELCLPVKLTTYVARHSFATILKREGVPTSIISETLGHSSERVTQIYLDSFENKQIDEAFSHLK